MTEQAPREILNGPEDLVAFALATGGHLRLPAAARPRVTHRASLRKAGLIFQQDQPFAPLGSMANRRQLLRPPGEALGLVEMIRHKTGLLKRKSQIVQ